MAKSHSILPKQKFTLPLVIIGALFLSLVLTLNISQQRQELRSKAAVGDLVSQGSIPSHKNLSGPYPVTVSNLIVGAKYRIVVSGTFKWDTDPNNSLTSDAQWDDNSPTVARNCFCVQTGPIYWNETKFRAIDGGTPKADHIYNFIWTANTTSLTMVIKDSNYTDNSGSLGYKMYVESLPTTPTKTPTPTPTKTPTPSPTKIPSPTATKTPTPTSQNFCTTEVRLCPDGSLMPRDPDCTWRPDLCSGVSVTPTPVSTKLSLNLLLHGLGKAGDAANPGVGGNPNPLHPGRTVTVQVFNAQNQLVVTKQGQVTYDPTPGSFKGTVDIGIVTNGIYTVKVKTNQFLNTLLPGIQTIIAGATHQLPVVSMINGDINNDNVINILDYDILLGCYSDFQPPASCTTQNKVLADLNDDGAVNQFDYNLFLRELTNVSGK